MLLRVSDLKQYTYCPRIVFFEYLMPVEKKTTYKMKHGKIAEGEIAALEKRRKLASYGLDKGQRSFNVWLTAMELELTGKIDMLIECEDTMYPVDFKYTERPPHKNHIYQTCGYALMLEELYQTRVNRGFVYLIPRRAVAVFTLEDHLKRRCRDMLSSIRALIEEEHMPEATRSRAKCRECEYQNYCRDIW